MLFCPKDAKALQKERKNKMSKLHYITKGTCSRAIDLEIENGIIKNVVFDGGCNGNTKGISSLVAGMNADEAVKRLSGIRCGMKSTSCPDQLAQAIKQLKDKD